MTIETFTRVHVLVSLVGIASGLIVVFGLLARRRLDGWTVLFLVATAATSVTGFGFPFDHLLPSHKVGVVSLVVLAVAIFARYGRHLVQAFMKVPALAALAPHQSEPPFLIAQLGVLLLFAVLTVLAAR